MVQSSQILIFFLTCLSSHHFLSTYISPIRMRLSFCTKCIFSSLWSPNLDQFPSSSVSCSCIPKCINHFWFTLCSLVWVHQFFLPPSLSVFWALLSVVPEKKCVLRRDMVSINPIDSDVSSFIFSRWSQQGFYTVKLFLPFHQ